MSENTAPTAGTITPELSAKLGAHEPAITAMVAMVNANVVTHDALIAQLSITADGDNTAAIEAIATQNPQNDKEIAKQNDAIAQIEERLAKLKASRNSLAEKYLPKPLAEDEKTKVQAQVKDLQTQYKALANGVFTYAKGIGLEDEVKSIVKPLTHMSGKKSGGSAGDGRGAGTPKIHSKEVYVNGELIQVQRQNKPAGDFASTLSGAANKIAKDHKVKVTAADLQVPYFESAGVTDPDKLPNDHTFNFTFKDGAGNELTKEIRVVRA